MPIDFESRPPLEILASAEQKPDALAFRLRNNTAASPTTRGGDWNTLGREGIAGPLLAACFRNTRKVRWSGAGRASHQLERAPSSREMGRHRS